MGSTKNNDNCTRAIEIEIEEESMSTQHRTRTRTVTRVCNDQKKVQ